MRSAPVAVVTFIALIARSFAIATELSAQGLSSVRVAVTNEFGRPIEQAQVTLGPQGQPRQLRTDRDGQAVFIGVSTGTHTIRVNWVGFSPESRQVDVSAGENRVEIVLKRLTSLSEVAVSARRTGVYGVVLERDSLRPIADARVELLGARTGDTTDASGQFSMGSANPGTFMLRVSHPMFDTRIVSVRVPADTGVGIDIVLRAGGVPLHNTMELGLAEMAQRINWAIGGGNSAIIGREEFKDRGSALDMAVKFAPSLSKRGLKIDEQACLFIDGVARPLVTISQISVDDVESIEVYGKRGDVTRTLEKMWPRRAICGNPSAPMAPENRAIYVAIWTRR